MLVVINWPLVFCRFFYVITNLVHEKEFERCIERVDVSNSGYFLTQFIKLCLLCFSVYYQPLRSEPPKVQATLT